MESATPSLDDQLTGLTRAIADLTAGKDEYTSPVAIADYNTYIAQIEAAKVSVENYKKLKTALCLVLNEGML